MIQYKDVALLHELSLQLMVSSSPEYEYMINRGVTPSQITEFGIGLTGPDLRGRIQGKVSTDFYRWLDRNKILDGKMVFPIHDPLLRVCGLQTRGLSAQTFHKIYAARSESLPSFLGLPQALESFEKTRVLYLTEGIFDFFALQNVVSNVVCVTTASISQTQLRFLGRFCKEVVVAFDMDKVGEQGYRKICTYLRNTPITVTKLDYPYKDLSEFLESDGSFRFQEHFRPMLELRDILGDLSLGDTF